MSFIQKIFTAIIAFSLSQGALFGAYSPKDYSNLLGHVEGIDNSLLRMHFILYEGYVKNTNELIETLETMSRRGQDKTLTYGALKRRMGWEYDGMVLHEYYFENLSGGKGLSKSDPLYKQIVEEFGSFEQWEANFKATGLIRGIGWVILYRDPIDHRLYNLWINEHDVGHLAGGTPILVMDVWEHAYITEFGLNRGEYIDVFMKNINWKVVSNRY